MNTTTNHGAAVPLPVFRREGKSRLERAVILAPNYAQALAYCQRNGFNPHFMIYPTNADMLRGLRCKVIRTPGWELMSREIIAQAQIVEIPA